MKQVKTKVLSILLAVVMMFGLMPSLGQVAYAAGESIKNLHWEQYKDEFVIKWDDTVTGPNVVYTPVLTRSINGGASWKDIKIQ